MHNDVEVHTVRSVLHPRWWRHPVQWWRMRRLNNDAKHDDAMTAACAAQAQQRLDRAFIEGDPPT